jgi:hypothetical protein
MRLSLVTVYRRREQHLAIQLAWWQRSRSTLAGCEWIVIEADAAPSPGLAAHLESAGCQYTFLPNPGILHKTRALNLGLQRAHGDFLAPLDVDLIPWENTLPIHLELASMAPQVLMTGYRLMLPQSTTDLNALSAATQQAAIAPEDHPTALRKHLLQGERFGVMPFFRCDRLRAIQGWDEAFIGWGAEDQDLMERYLGEQGYLVRSPQLVYLHLHHDPEPQWREAEIIEANRHKYYQKRAANI